MAAASHGGAVGPGRGGASSPTATAPATPAAANPASSPVRPGVAGGAIWADEPRGSGGRLSAGTPSSAASPTAAANSSAGVWYRRAGFLAIMVASTRASPSGTAGLYTRGSTTASFWCAWSLRAAVPGGTGGRPVAAW